jgi:hypothetical protein
MAVAATGANEALVVASGVIIVAVVLGARQWRSRQGRTNDLSAVDARHFRRQDVRRLMNSAIMVVIAIGLVAGTRLNPLHGQLERRAFLLVWLAVTILLCVLLILALVDWVATRSYATRQRRALLGELSTSLATELRRLRARHDGHGDETR